MDVKGVKNSKTAGKNYEIVTLESDKEKLAGKYNITGVTVEFCLRVLHCI